MNAPTTAAGPDAGGAAPTVRRRWRPPVSLVGLLVTVVACVAVVRALDGLATSHGTSLAAAVTVLVGALVGGVAAAVTVVAVGTAVMGAEGPPRAGLVGRAVSLVGHLVVVLGGLLALLGVGAVSLLVAFVGLLAVEDAEGDAGAAERQQRVVREIGDLPGVVAARAGEVVSTSGLEARRDVVVVHAELEADADQRVRESTVEAVAAVVRAASTEEGSALALVTDGSLTVDVTGSPAAAVERLAVATALLEGTDARTVAVLRHSSASGVLHDQPGGTRPTVVRLVGGAAPADLVTQSLAVLPASWGHETSVEVATTAAPDPGLVDPDDASLLAGRRSLSVEPSRHHRDVMAARALDAQAGVLGYAVGDDDGPTEDRVGVADPARADEVVAAVRAARGLRDADVTWGAAPQPVVTVLAPGRDGRPVEVAVG